MESPSAPPLAANTSGKYTIQIQQETAAAQSLGVRGTPGFVVNGVYVAGVQPFEVFAHLGKKRLEMT